MQVLAALMLVVAGAAAAPKSLPSSWKRCDKSDPALGECLQKAVAYTLKDLGDKGSKSLGVLPTDPLFLSHLEIGQSNGPVSLDLKFKDINIHGLKKIQTTGPAKADFKNGFELEIPVSVPEGLALKGHYQINGKVLVLPITGEGECELHLENVTALAHLKGKDITKDGEKYLEVTDFTFQFDTTRFRLNFQNLFNGNKELGTQMNQFLNDNWKDILHELKPAITDAFGAVFAEITNRIFLKVPSSKLFL